jgi:hypothetical protein
MSTPRTTTSRGYGTTHQKIRKTWEPKVAAGNILCARCHQPIHPDHPWDLGHTDDRTGYQGPEHASCNRSAGATNSNQQRRTTQRDW